jgi:hypothetical protein
MIKKLFIVFSIPVVLMIIVFLVSSSCKNWENPLIATGTVGAAVAAIWTIIYIELFKPYFDRPKLEIKEPGFKPQFYRQAPEKDMEGNQTGTGFYINILLINNGTHMAKNCQPVLTGMWKHTNDKWEKEVDWVSVGLQWAAGEHVVFLGPLHKIREERNIVPNRPYYFNLGNITTRNPQVFKILQTIKLYAQDDEFGPGEYYFEVRVTGEEVNLPPKYFHVIWRGDCTANLTEVEQRLKVFMKDYPPA